MKLFLLNENGESVWVAIADICLISPTSSGPAFTARDGAVYRYPHTMEQLVRHFADYGFERLDRNAIANLDAAEWYDPVQRKVYFELPEKEGAEALYATVSVANAAKVKHMNVRECSGMYSAHPAA
ncbi:hypothetical protein [Paenibacillus glycinis]|uniref:HTH LytTR-type domain-containing protein n=1 Tax=Paenibacillus glycinis TaxID=2697035 RepID=A0ABW9XTZ0_9BACL|nr:hypothetical protein [Paenibacillus glycinis]NBD26130.1 hypothetical protein [Paenibacillus glycinis]